MKPRRPSLALERAASHLLRARTELEEAARTLAPLSEASGDRLALAAAVAAEQAKLVEALAAAIHAAPHTALDDLVAALTQADGAATRTRRH